MESKSQTREKSVSSKKSSRKTTPVIEEMNKSGVSVITKSTSPKVVIGAEQMDNDDFYSHRCNGNEMCKGKLIKLACFITLGIIVLITFFVSLRTYKLVEETNRNITQMTQYFFG